MSKNAMSKNAMSSGQARSIKISGDRLRKCFEKQCTDINGYIKQEYLKGLNNQYLNGTYILKSGKNWQFHLGTFSPYTENWGVQYYLDGKIIKFLSLKTKIIDDLRDEKFIKLFMLKGNFFTIYDAPNWLIFDAKDIINLMEDSDFIQWRILETGRIKGDIYFENIKRTIFTMEYRAEIHKKQFVFGAHGGGAGEKLKNILKNKLFFNSIPVDYSLWIEIP
jgi:hypothetical protein